MHANVLSRLSIYFVCGTVVNVVVVFRFSRLLLLLQLLGRYCVS